MHMIDNNEDEHIELSKMNETYLIKYDLKLDVDVGLKVAFWRRRGELSVFLKKFRK
jgi:hypothetical protein